MRSSLTPKIELKLALIRRAQHNFGVHVMSETDEGVLFSKDLLDGKGLFEEWGTWHKLLARQRMMLRYFKLVPVRRPDLDARAGESCLPKALATRLKNLHSDASNTQDTTPSSN